MTPLEKELTKRAENSMQQAEDAVNEVKLLLEANAAEEIRTLRSIGLSAGIDHAESKMQDKIIRKSKSEYFGKSVLHIDELKAFCWDYRLYMKKAHEYIGTIPPELGSELNRFCNDKKIPLPNYAQYTNFYIVAPPKMFSDYLSPFNTFKSAFDKVAENSAKWLESMIPTTDPILVYQIPEQKEYYAVIKSWGNDFSWLRRIYGIFTKPFWVNIMLILFTAGVFWLGWTLGIMQQHYFLSIKVGEQNPLPVFGLVAGWIIIGGITGIFTIFPPAWDFRKDWYRAILNRPGSLR